MPRNPMPTDIVFLKNLRTEAVIGIYEWERHTKQRIRIDLEMATDAKRVAEHDRIEDALDYKAVSKRLQQFVRDSQFQLVESLAEHIAAIIIDEFNVSWVRLSVSKPGALRNASDVGILIERGKP